MNLRAIIEPDPTGGYVVHVPGLRGCWSQGETRDEALTNIREATELWLESQSEMAAEEAAPESVDVLSI